MDLKWAEEIATEHAEAAVYGEELRLTVRVELVKGARAVRRTWILRTGHEELLVEVLTEWVRGSHGRPAPAPTELVELAADATAATLAARRRRR